MTDIQKEYFSFIRNIQNYWTRTDVSCFFFYTAEDAIESKLWESPTRIIASLNKKNMAWAVTE